MTLPPSSWWRRAAIYELYLQSFADGDGDGIGDLAGVRARLPYLASLGIDAIWFSPWYPSPRSDAGYDVADYRSIDPAFGTLADADALIAEGHALGIRTIIDIVPNHCSDQHRWFQAALAAPPGSAERARFWFRPGRGDLPPNNWQSIFGGSAWTRTTTRDGEPGEWYLHLLGGEQVQVPLPRLAVPGRRPGPGGAAEDRLPVVRGQVATARAEPEPGAFGRAWRGGQRGLEPPVLVRTVVRHDVDDRPDAERVALGDQRVGVGQGAERGVDGTVVGDVVAGVGPRGRIPRAEPDRVDAEAREIGQPGADPGQVADAVAVAVGEALHVQLVDRGGAPEAGVGGHGSSVILSL